MTEDNAVDRLRKLREEISTLESEAKEELLTEIHARIDELNELGFSYHLKSGGRKVRMRTKSERSRPAEPPRDARADRAQEVGKKTFAAEEPRELRTGKTSEAP